MNPFSSITSYASGLLDTVSSWVADDSMAAAARAGLGIGSDVYSMLDPRMVRAPVSTNEAYEQAIYFVAIGVRRAISLGSPSRSSLEVGLNTLISQASDAADDSGFICNTTGYLCSNRGAAHILGEAIDIINSSGLAIDDRQQLVSILGGNKWAVQVKQAVPTLIAVGVGAVIGTWLYQRRQRQQRGGS